MHGCATGLVSTNDNPTVVCVANRWALLQKNSVDETFWVPTKIFTLTPFECANFLINKIESGMRNFDFINYYLLEHQYSFHVV